MKIHIAESAPAHAVQVRLDPDIDTSYLSKTEARQILVYGIDGTLTNPARIASIARGVMQEAHRLKLSDLVLDYLDVLPFDENSDLFSEGRLYAMNLMLAAYRSGKYKMPSKGYSGVENFYVINCRDDEAAGLRTGAIIGVGVNTCRELVDEPSNYLYPEEFGRRVEKLAEGIENVRVVVKHYAELEKDGYGLLCAVGKGAKNKPCLIELSYDGKPDSSVTDVAIVGKGVTLDIGGTDLKLSGAIQGMQKDMGGGAAAIMAVLIAAKLKLPVNAVAIVPAAENLVSSDCYRTMDVIKGLDGKTVEILNTDAEGRLVLRDGITHALNEHDPHLLVTVATLTGAIRIALGNRHTGFFCSDDSFVDHMKIWGEETGNDVWHMPHEGYEADLESSVAYIANVQPNGGKMGGSCVAAAFLADAAKDMNGIFAHLDIAGTGMEGTGKDGLFKGAATGVPVPLLVQMLEHWKPES